MQILKYKRNYTQADTFKNATISIGHALLKNNINNLNNDIKLYFLRFPNLKSLKIKFLHFYPNLINQNKTKNPYREWVLANSILNTHKNVDSVIRTLSNEFTIIDKKNRYEWNTESGKKIYLSVVKSSLENETIYFYRGTLSEY